ncbi:MAG: D-alanine--D-alanine ligase [Coriobacteriia bacterium]|nr:D-alanine--D-alanine ligase [Coriobacteriia bacterium]
MTGTTDRAAKSPQAIDISSMTIVVLQGGVSAEREVSLRSGHNIAQGLNELGASVVVMDAADLSFIEKLRTAKPDLVFNALHGKFGEDGTIQGLLEILGIPYTGSGVLASSLAMNKQVSKDIFAEANLTTPKGVLVSKDELRICDQEGAGTYSYATLAEKLGTRDLVVKPNGEGSSVGVSLVSNEEDFRAGLEQALSTDSSALVEECIPGRELTVAVLGDATSEETFALPIIEIIPKTEFYHYENKYAAGATDFTVPADLDQSITDACQQLAVAAHKVLGCQGYSRSDIRLNNDGAPYLLETNTLPGLTEGSLLPRAAAAADIKLPELLSQIIKHALTK